MNFQKLKRQDFVFLKGKDQKLKGRYFVLLYFSVISEREAGLSFIVSRKHGNAVKRNLQKRWIRAMCRQECEQFFYLFQKMKLLIIALPVSGSYIEKLTDFRKCLKRLESRVESEALC